MDIENEWEQFLISDSSGSVNEAKVVKPESCREELPKCSPIYISTKTNIAYFNIDTIDLSRVFWKIKIMNYDEDREGIIKKQMKFNSITRDEKDAIEILYEKEDVFKTQDIITHIDTVTSKKDVYKDVRKISIGISKKDVQSYRIKKKSAFYNCFVVILRLYNAVDDTFKEVHIKIFNTGKIEVPGIQDDAMFYKSVDYMKCVLQEYYEEIDYSKHDIETVLINSNFSCGYLVNRDALYDILVDKYKIQSLYDPCSYPGVQSKYIITEPEKTVDLSFMIFRTGSVLIVGKCDKEHIIIVYEFLQELFINEYDNINQNNIRVDIDTPKIKKQQKQRRRTIERPE